MTAGRARLVVRGEVRVPGDKSVSHRALMFGALADGRSSVRGILQSADIESTAGALRALGWHVPDLAPVMEVHGQGLGHQLIDAAITQARRRKADVLEAYPVDPDSPSYRHMGFVPAFERAGFVEDGREGTRRHVMHLPL